MSEAEPNEDWALPKEYSARNPVRLDAVPQGRQEPDYIIRIKNQHFSSQYNLLRIDEEKNLFTVVGNGYCLLVSGSLIVDMMGVWL